MLLFMFFSAVLALVLRCFILHVFFSPLSDNFSSLFLENCFFFSFLLGPFTFWRIFEH